ncbi:MAG: hypothetical protein ACFFBD_05960 [Candidatus Hodarchaeota archaeon]
MHIRNAQSDSTSCSMPEYSLKIFSQKRVKTPLLGLKSCGGKCMFSNGADVEDLKLDWVLEKEVIEAGEECIATVTLRNTGDIPIEYPFQEYRRYVGKWFLTEQLLEERRCTYLGPLNLEAKAGKIHKDQELQGTMNLGLALAALGSGKHLIQLIYYYRLHYRGHSGYNVIIETPMYEIELQTPPDWSNSYSGIIAGINSPDTAIRDQAWQKFQDPQVHVAMELPGITSMQEVINGDFPGKILTLNVRQYNQEVRREEYTLVTDGEEGDFVWKWDEEDIRGGVSTKVEDWEVKDFFKRLSQGVTFDHVPVQIFGGTREKYAKVYLQVHRKDGELEVECQSPNLWVSELETHPTLSKWYLLLRKWKSEYKTRETGGIGGEGDILWSTVP